MSQASLISLKDIQKTFSRGSELIHALAGVNLEIRPGSFYAITGSSGSGKSTLLSILGMLDVPSRGQYYFNDELVSELSDTKRSHLRNCSLGFIFQSFHLLPRLSALDNVMMPLTYAGVNNYKERKDRATSCLQKVGLEDRMLHLPNQLSGGQRQRVAIARALVNNPKLLLADEPTGNLDSKTGIEVLALLEALHAAGTTLLLVTHDRELAARAPKRIHLRDGVIDETF